MSEVPPTIKDSSLVPTQKKNTKTPAQLELLAKARVRAFEVRKENQGIRNKQKEIDVMEKMKERLAIEKKHQEMSKASEPEPERQPPATQEPEPEPEPEPKKVRKPKAPAPPQSDSDSDDGYTYVRVKKKHVRTLSALPPKPVARPGPSVTLNQKRNPLFI